MRNNLRKAVKLLKEAGWTVKNGALVNQKTGQPMTIEFLLVSPLFERIVQPYLRNLERLGIKGSIRLVDSAQYTRRLNGFDYDVIVGNFAQSDSPGNEQRDFWGSEAADREGSTNLIGIKNKRSTSSSTTSSSPRTARSWSRRRARLTACSCGTISWCRNGSRPMCALPIGTAMDSPISYRG